MSKQNVQVTLREDTSTAATKLLRKQGVIPAVIYGKKMESTAIQMPEKAFREMVRTYARSVIRIDVPGIGIQPAILHNVQRDKVMGNIIHIDFRQVDLSEPIKTSVRIAMEGEAVGIKEGGTLQISIQEVDIVCLPDAIPASLKVDVSGLNIGDSLTVADLVIPEGIELRAELTDSICSVLAPRLEEELETETAEDEDAEPEVIGEDAEEDSEAEA